MESLALFLSLVVVVVVGGIFFILSHTPQGETESAKKIEGTNFIPSQMFMGNDGLGGVAVNERTHQICLFKSPTAPPILLPITDLLGSYLVKNGEILGEGKRSYPKEIVTFVSGLHRKKESLIKNLYITSPRGNERIDLLIVVHDFDDPILVVNFLDMETKEGGILFEKAMSTATHWHYVLDGLILEADRSARIQAEVSQENELAEASP